MRCAACDHPDQGYAHSCAGSGTFLAAEAHIAGEVDEIAQAWPRFKITIGFRLRALDEQHARDKISGLAAGVLSDDDVEDAEFAIMPLEVRAG